MKRWLLCFLLACGDDSQATVEDDGFMGCPADSPPLQLGLQARGSTLTATVVDARYVPARRYLNDWTFQFADQNGMPLKDVSVLSARTFMPVHGHDGLVTPQVRSTSDPSELQIASLNFNMRGPWEVQLSLRSALGTDNLVFHVCIAE